LTAPQKHISRAIADRQVLVMRPALKAVDVVAKRRAIGPAP